MSEYCSQCSPFKPHFDINLFEIALELENGKTEHFICEGCKNRGIHKNSVGGLFLLKIEDQGLTKVQIKIEMLM